MSYIHRKFDELLKDIEVYFSLPIRVIVGIFSIYPYYIFILYCFKQRFYPIGDINFFDLTFITIISLFVLAIFWHITFFSIDKLFRKILLTKKILSSIKAVVCEHWFIFLVNIFGIFIIMAYGKSIRFFFIMFIMLSIFLAIASTMTDVKHRIIATCLIPFLIPAMFLNKEDIDIAKTGLTYLNIANFNATVYVDGNPINGKILFSSKDTLYFQKYGSDTVLTIKRDTLIPPDFSQNATLHQTS